MYPAIENVWGALTGTFKHKHLWLDYRIWPSKYQTNLRATNFPGQPVIVTGPGLTIAEWLLATTAGSLLTCLKQEEPHSMNSPMKFIFARLLILISITTVFMVVSFSWDCNWY
jgi:hypothetical protein